MTGLATRAEETADLRLLLEQVHALSGYDFRDYAVEGMHARVVERMAAESVPTIDALRTKVVGDEAARGRLIEALAARPATIFRAPEFMAAFRRHIVPALRTYPTVRLWHAGCGGGGETFALAVLLREEGLLPRCLIYGTDVSPAAVRAAKEGRFPLEMVQAGERGYAASGGAGRLSDHLGLDGAGFRFHDELRERITFFEHGFATDASFNEFNVIVSRYALCQLSRTLLGRVYRLFDQSLCALGFLAGARPEALAQSPLGLKLETLDKENGLYRKVR
jgi:chemotaxis protein methyltransferase CheR